jgi:hypothetical protein
MAKKLYKASEWQSGSGNWYVNNTSDLAGIAGEWWIPARILGITPAAYVEWLVKNYHPDNLSFNNDVLLFSWKSEHYSLCHKYLLDINRIARQKNFLV